LNIGRRGQGVHSRRRNDPAPVVAAIIAMSSTSCVRTGHVGVRQHLRTRHGRTLSEGIHIVNPVASVTELSIKTQEIKEKAAVPSKEGLIMGLEASILYHLDPAQAATVYQQIGPTYAEVLLVPTFRSAIRAITAGNTAASRTRTGARASRNRSWRTCGDRSHRAASIVENVLLRDLQLPETLKHAIEAKQQAQQEAQRMEFVLQREKAGSRAESASRRPASRTSRTSSARESARSSSSGRHRGDDGAGQEPNSKVIIVGNSKTVCRLIYSGDKQ
jgi:regulator of protease activity HflC (stomatin/prohibitin superfamily)